MTKPTVLLDLDNTIFDADALLVHINQLIDVNYGNGAHKDFSLVCQKVIDEKGFLDWKEVAIRFAKLKNSPDYASILAIFLEIRFEDYWRPYASALLDFLSENSNLIIFSRGDKFLQKRKAEKLGLFEKANEVIIAESKTNLLTNIGKKYGRGVIVIDDLTEVLNEAKKILHDPVIIWIKYGRHTQGHEIVGADFETENLKDVIAYLKKIIK